MPLHPNLHLLLPSSTPDVLLETRLYLPPKALDTLGLGTSSSSKPAPLSTLSQAHQDAIRALRITKVVVGAHPWGRLGGNMLFPVLTHVADAIYSSPALAQCTAYATFNVRGVGHSGGSMPWPGWAIGHDGKDFAAVEKAVLELVADADSPGVELYRLGYSYGTNLALNAPITHPVKRTMLVSPAPTLFKAMTLFCGPTFAAGLGSALDRAAQSRAAGDARSLWLVFGTSDDFTGVSTLRALGGERRDEITSVEIEGCGHFYTREQDARALRKAVGEWLSE